MTLALKRIPAAGIPLALQKAEHYRDLNQPDEAESICRDILDVDPGHQGALRILGLALTDRFAPQWVTLFDEALAAFRRLEAPYDQRYYSGIAWERCAKAQLEHGQVRNAYHSFRRAMELFEEASELAPADSPDPILRWNRCVRALTSDSDLSGLGDDEHEGFRYDE